MIKPFYNLYIIFWTKKRNYPVKQQAHAKSLAVWLSTFFILVWPVWLQFGHCTVVGYLVRYMPFVVAPCKNPSKKDKLNGILLPNCSDLQWEKIVLVIEKNFRNSRLKAENLQNFWDHWNNLFKQWKVRTIFGDRMLFKLVPGGFSEIIH